eukprot:GILK01024746.1.p1 GENE.GILK01024746.1~~GILK01024746.1.p1  ORF type:complete len:135 (-),score=12.29 GILK01024746.1:123-527(-)
MQELEQKLNPPRIPVPANLVNAELQSTSGSRSVGKATLHQTDPNSVGHQRGAKKQKIVDPAQVGLQLGNLRSELELVDQQLMIEASRTLQPTIRILNERWRKNKARKRKRGVERICIDTTDIEWKLRDALGLGA